MHDFYNREPRELGMKLFGVFAFLTATSFLYTSFFQGPHDSPYRQVSHLFTAASCFCVALGAFVPQERQFMHKRVAPAFWFAGLFSTYLSDLGPVNQGPAQESSPGFSH